MDTTKQFRLVYTYYNNPSMLEMQIDNWNRYPPEIRDHFGVVLVDDCSPNIPALPIMKRCTLAKALYRVDVDVPWAMHAARNIGAKEAGGDDVWMLVTDMDTVLPPESASRLLNKRLDPAKYYSFERDFVPATRVRKVHHDTYLVRRNVFWQVGGYDEDYMGSYDHEGPFLRQLAAIAPHEHLDDVLTLCYRSTAIADANTQLSRNQDRFWRLFEKKCIAGDERAKNPCRSTWMRQL